MSCFACGSARGVDHVRVSPDVLIAFCRTCGSGRSQSPPQAHEYGSLYGRDYYKAWGLNEANNQTDSLKRATFARRLDECAVWLAADAKVLDLGCATGSFLREAQSRGWQAFGIDVSEHAIAECAATIDPSRLYCGEFESSPFGDDAAGPFDAIFMSDYLEHVLDPSAVLARAAARLVPGGAIVITTPDVGSFSRRTMRKRWPHFKAEHVSYFSRKGLASLLGSAGLELASIRSTRKALSIAYAAAQFQRYRNPWITSWLAPLRRALPSTIADARLWVRTGEMTVVAVKSP